MVQMVDKKIDFCCWVSHHFEHMIPVWRKIPGTYKGKFYIATHRDAKLPGLAKRMLDEHELAVFDNETDLVEAINRENWLMMVNTDVDKLVSRINRPLARMQHGAGQSFVELNYRLFRRNVVLDLVPSRYTAEEYRRKYPGTKAEVVGCPKMDEWHVRPARRTNEKPVVALSFHYDRPLNPETISAWPHFKSALQQVANDERWTLIGHGHPYMIEQLRPHYEANQVEVVESFHEVMERADIYVCDQSSTIYEFASTGRPVVLMNAPWFRRDVEHGMRFWEHADVGIHCDEPEHLAEAIAMAIADPPEQRQRREKCVDAVYAVRDGTASDKAAAALVNFLSSPEYAAKVMELASAGEQDYPGIRELVNARIQDVEKTIGRTAKVAIYGGGEHTVRLLEKLPYLASRLVAVIDKNYENMDPRLFGGKLLPKSALTYTDIDLLILSSQAHENQILEELRQETVMDEKQIMALYGDHAEFESDIFNELYFGQG